MRASGGPSILKELSNERIAVDMEDAVRMNVHGVAVQVFVGGEYETQSIENMTRLVDAGYRYGIPVLGVTAVGKELTRDARYLGLATRICAELGAQVVKTYYCDEGFERVTAGCPVPIVMAGGKKLPELEALTMAYRAIQEGASGVDMGRNIFQSESPVGDDRGGREGRARERDAGGGLRGVPGDLARQDTRARTVMKETARHLLAGGPHVSIGVLTADLLRLGEELGLLREAGAELVHVDVMDGVFCPQMTVGPPFVAALTEPFLKDVHLMIERASSRRSTRTSRPGPM